MSDQPDPWSWSKFLQGPFVPKNYGKLIVYCLCAVVIILLLSGAVAIKNKLFPPPPQQSGTTSTVGTVEAGGHVENITYQSPTLKQGIYGEISSNDFGVGIFKEVHSNIDLSIGIEKDFDEDELEVKVQSRFKF